MRVRSAQPSCLLPLSPVRCIVSKQLASSLFLSSFLSFPLAPAMTSLLTGAWQDAKDSYRQFVSMDKRQVSSSTALARTG